MTDPGHTRRDARRVRDRRRVAWCALLVGCLVVLAWPAVEGIRVSRSQLNGTWHKRAASEAALFDCLDGRIAGFVSPGERVYVSIDVGVELSDLDPSGLDSAVYLRVTESVAARAAVPMLSTADADLTLLVRFDERDAAACDGYAVSVVRT